MDKSGDYLIYATTKDYNPKDEWGGCHVTIAGTHKNTEENLLTIIRNIDNVSLQDKSWKPYEWTISKWKDRWTMVIKSNTLNAIANRLNDQGVKNLKGPDFAGSRFHVTLPKEIISKSDAKQYAKNLSTNEWFLTIAKRKEPACQWKHHMPLHKCAC